MKVYRAEQIRNVALISHVGAGKTSLVDAALYDSGAVTRQGKVDDGTSISDYDPDELKRHMSLNVKVLTVEWKDHKINFIDSPGYADFVGEVKAGLRVADAALVVGTAEKGVEVGTELSWQYADERKLPRMVFINKLDRENTSFDQALESLRKQFGVRVVPLQLPIGEQSAFRGVVDLVSQKAYCFEGGNKVQEIPVPAAIKDRISTYREQLIESAVESDDAMMEKFLEGEELSDEEILSVVKLGTRTGQLIPVLCGSGSKNIGVQALLDAIVDYLPSPVDVLPEDVKTFGKNLSIFVFKNAAAQVGTISTFRVYSGTLKSDTHVYNVRTKADERMAQLVTPRGNNQEPANEIPAGDIAAVASYIRPQNQPQEGPRNWPPQAAKWWAWPVRRCMAGDRTTPERWRRDLRLRGQGRRRRSTKPVYPGRRKRRARLAQARLHLRQPHGLRQGRTGGWQIPPGRLLRAIL